uniref:Uncharacterized protein n=1 Tax=Anopheles dirus TaxID=7168 RepID=A0A182NGZ4_9DIPT
MTARCKKRRNQNNAIRRAKNKIKETKKLKKMLGFIEEDLDGSDLLAKLKDITAQKKTETELDQVKQEAMDEIREKETKAVKKTKKEKHITVVHPKTKVAHVYNVKTKKDQFGQYPVWYKARKEKTKQNRREGKSTKMLQFRGRRLHYIDRTCNWNALG